MWCVLSCPVPSAERAHPWAWHSYPAQVEVSGSSPLSSDRPTGLCPQSLKVASQRVGYGRGRGRGCCVPAVHAQVCVCLPSTPASVTVTNVHVLTPVLTHVSDVH